MVMFSQFLVNKMHLTVTISSLLSVMPASSSSSSCYIVTDFITMTGPWKMAKNEKGGGAQSKPPKQQPHQANDSQVVPHETSSELIRRIELLDGSRSSVGGGVKTVGETAQGPVRSSAFSTYNRVVRLAIDAHPAALYAFQWSLKHIWRHEDLLVFSHTPETPTLVNVYFKKRPIPADRRMDEGDAKLQRADAPTSRRVRHRMR